VFCILALAYQVQNIIDMTMSQACMQLC